jgi:predicted DNA-binding transcriptional regulator AlpA
MADFLPLRIHTAEMDTPTDPASLPLVADARRLAPMLSAGLRTLRSWDAAGKLPAPVRIGGRVVWRLDEIRAWLAAGAPCRAEWEAIKATSQHNSSRTQPR